MGNENVYQVIHKDHFLKKDVKDGNIQIIMIDIYLEKKLQL